MVKQATAVILAAVLSIGSVPGENGPDRFAYRPPTVQVGLFDEEIGMFEQERREYATNLAAFAADHVVEAKATPDSLVSARRILALALHLDRRNREALIVNGQLKRGVLPEVKKGDYNARTFSRLLLTRAKILGRAEDENQKLLARCFVELAALTDPRNEDAIFAYEVQLIDHGELDWRVLTDAPKDPPSRAPEEAK